MVVEKTAQQDIVWNSDDQSGLLYHKESVSWHIDYDFNVLKNKENTQGKKLKLPILAKWGGG